MLLPTVLTTITFLATFSDALRIPIAPRVKRSTTEERTALQKKYERLRENYARNVKRTPLEEHMAPLQAATRSMREGELRKRQNPGFSNVAMTDYATPGFDSQYIVYMGLGSPVQEIPVQVDTGSSDPWVIGVGTPGATGQVTYDSSKSTTWKSTGTTFDDQYGSGEVTGTVGLETIYLGSFGVANSYLGVSKQISDDFSNQPTSGIFGFGQGIMTSYGTYTFFENLIRTGLVTKPVFSMFLTDDGYSVTQPGLESGSQLCLGCVLTPPIATSGSLVYYPNIVAGYWEIAGAAIAVNGNAIWSKPYALVVDSGTSLMVWPVAAAAAFYAAIPGSIQTSQGQYAVPKSSAASLTSLTMTIGTTTYAIKTQDLIIGYADNAGQYYELAISGTDQPDSAGNLVFICGDTFMKSVYSVFSYDIDGNGTLGVGLQQLDNTVTQTAVPTVAGAPSSVSEYVATASTQSIQSVVSQTDIIGGGRFTSTRSGGIFSATRSGATASAAATSSARSSGELSVGMSSKWVAGLGGVIVGTMALLL